MKPCKICHNTKIHVKENTDNMTVVSCDTCQSFASLDLWELSLDDPLTDMHLKVLSVIDACLEAVNKMPIDDEQRQRLTEVSVSVDRTRNLLVKEFL